MPLKIQRADVGQKRIEEEEDLLRNEYEASDRLRLNEGDQEEGDREREVLQKLDESLAVSHRCVSGKDRSNEVEILPFQEVQLRIG